MILYTLFFLTLLFGIITISTTNIVISIFSLLMTYFFAVWILCLIGMEYLAFIILIVYLGALVVLFLFVIMTLPVQKSVGMVKDNRSLFLTILFMIFFHNTMIIGESEVDFSFLDFHWTENIEQLGIFSYYYSPPIVILMGYLLFTSLICVLRSK